MAVSAELQGVPILLSPWVTSDQLKIHFLPIQLSFVRQDQSLANLKIKWRKVISGESTKRIVWGFLVPKISAPTPRKAQESSLLSSPCLLDAV